MIDVMFGFVDEHVLVRIDGNHITFCSTSNGSLQAPIDGLKLSYEGTIKEFPDLKGKDNWRDESIKRFKEKIKQMKKERDIKEYIIKELSGFGYKPLYEQVKGMRVKKL